MKIAQTYLTKIASWQVQYNPLAQIARREIEDSIIKNVTPGETEFVLNNSKKNCNGVKPVKEMTYAYLVAHGWEREKPLAYLSSIDKGGPIDAYKLFQSDDRIFRVGMEFETGNIGSSYRSMNKLCLGIQYGDFDMGILMMSMKKTAYYLTDRVSNYEEAAPYFSRADQYAMIFYGFDADRFDPTAPLLPKGKDGNA